MSRTIVIGDVHGCSDELARLLARTGAGPTDRVVLVGDLVAKGPDSQGVVQLARERGLLAVLGNHDAKVLDIGPRDPKPGKDGDRDDDDRRDGARRKGPGDHAEVARALTPADWAYLESLPLMLPLDDV